jgi:anti-sigma regulatory factor (Ser/Thr protein kinase)
MDTIFDFSYTISPSLSEERVWRRDIGPLFTDVPAAIERICVYGVSEMVNNVLSHSGSATFQVRYERTDTAVRFIITDQGVGLFAKIAAELDLDDPRDAFIELAKGKYTSDPAAHSGEGVFFTSRMFDHFAIHSGGLSYFGPNSEQFYAPSDVQEGTQIELSINLNSKKTTKEVFDMYIDPDMEPGFFKTIIPVRLMLVDRMELISRSQAKRLLARIDRFLDVVLDFDGIDFIGQAFADEIFRVYPASHPDIKIEAINCGEETRKMIVCVSR